MFRKAAALNRYRGQGQQKVTVEHVHVHSGGQAIVEEGVEASPGVDLSRHQIGGSAEEDDTAPGAIDVETELGTTEIWEIVSMGMAHPFHIHGASFRILSIDGTPPPARLSGWKDVVLVEDKAELLVAFNRPATREYPFMYHCHILEHEDAGLMGQYVCT